MAKAIQQKGNSSVPNEIIFGHNFDLSHWFTSSWSSYFFSGLFSSSGTEKMVAYDLYGKDFLKWDLLFCLKAFYRRFLCVLAYEGREEDELEKKKK